MSLSVIFEEYNYLIVIIATALSLLSLIIAIVNSIRTRRIMRKYKKLMRGMDNKNLEAMLMHHLNSVQDAITRIVNLEHNHQLVVKDLESCLQKVGIIRYNPFEQMGSDLSFSVALLDKKGDGVVLTGLFTRNSSSIYAKPITNRTSTYPLSQEEIEAINKAMS